MRRFITAIMIATMVLMAAGCSSDSEGRQNAEVVAPSNQSAKPVESASSSEFDKLVAELENDLYLLVGEYINGEITFDSANTEFKRVVSEYSDAVLDEVTEDDIIEIFFMFGEDNPDDELILTVYDGLEYCVTGVYRGETPSTGGEPSSTGNETTISYEQEIILMIIAEDIAKQIAQNPGTVKSKAMYWGFEREGHTFWVQGSFECSNLFGVKEDFTIQVVCVANSDYSKITPEQVYLNGERIQ